MNIQESIDIAIDLFVENSMCIYLTTIKPRRCYNVFIRTKDIKKLRLICNVNGDIIERVFASKALGVITCLYPTICPEMNMFVALSQKRASACMSCIN